MVQVIESELEIGHISKPVSLPFQRFDFVVDSFHQATRDAVEVIVQEPMTVVHEGGGDFLEFLDAGLFSIRAPCI